MKAVAIAFVILAGMIYGAFAGGCTQCVKGSPTRCTPC